MRQALWSDPTKGRLNKGFSGQKRNSRDFVDDNHGVLNFQTKIVTSNETSPKAFLIFWDSYARTFSLSKGIRFGGPFAS